MKYFYSFLLIIIFPYSFIKCNAQTITVTPVIKNLPALPIGVENCGDSRLFVVLQAGQIVVADSNYVLSPLPFLNIANKITSGGETGLLGLAFHPDYKNNGYFYINYTRYVGPQLQSVIARYTVSASDPNRADSLSELILFTVNQPYVNHNGGSVKFGPDGYLYMGFGDGGSGNDPLHNGQNVNVKLGKVLRIDVNKDSLYAIPPDNPFVGLANHQQEIWSYGNRNPWRITFDRFTGDLWIADVGQNVWEEIDFQKAGAPGGRNYGWVCYEGDVYTNLESDCAPYNTFTFPVYTYNHTNGNCSITGGYLYRGAQMGDFFGKYIFGDYCSGFINEFELKDSSAVQIYHDASISSFGEDYRGELYVCEINNKTVSRINQVHCFPVSYIFNDDSMAVCPGQAATLSGYQGQGFTYQWFHNSDTIVGAINSDYIAADTGKYNMVVTNANGCSASSKLVKIAFKPTPSISINVAPGLCSNNSPVLLSATPAGGTFYGSGVDTSYFNPAIVSAGKQTIYYNFIDSNNCLLNDSAIINIETPPTITFNVATGSCLGEAPVLLNANPIGGVFSGTGIDTGYFHPANVAAGSYIIYYTYTDSANICTTKDSTNFKVFPLPQISFSLPDTVCDDAGNNVDLNGAPAGGVYSGDNGVSFNGGNHALVSADNKIHYITYTYTDSNSCSSFKTDSIFAGICTGIEELSKTDFNIYPNPSDDYILVSNIGTYSFNEILITNTLGQVISDITVDKKDINIKVTLPPANGIYFILLKGSKGEIVRKVLKQ